MSSVYAYALLGIALFCLGLFGLILQSHLLRKILGINIMGSGIFMVLIALASRDPNAADPVPHAMVITGIVVAVSATALALVLMLKLKEASGAVQLLEQDGGDTH